VNVRIVKKSGVWHQRAADRALRLASFGKMRSYLTGYVTTLGHTIYVPDDFDRWPALRREQVLRHEHVHVRQFERHGWLYMIVVYGLIPYGRARLEWEAYEETLRAVRDTEGIDAARSPRLRAEIVRRFTSADYLWMWPFPRTINRWIDDALQRLGGERSKPGAG
jgi:hypothetical protein